MSVVNHPSSFRLRKEVWARYDRLERHHAVAVNQMRLGMLALNFTDDELALLSDRLCPNDYALLKKAGRDIERPASVKRITSD